MKRILTSLSTGFRTATSSYTLVLALYLINMIIALPLALVFRGILDSTVGTSLALNRFIGDFDYTAFSEFLFKGGDKISTLNSELHWMIFLSMLVTTFLGGGVLGMLNSEDHRFRFSPFFGWCGKYFLRFLRLTILFGVLLVMVYTASTGLFEMIYDAVDKNAVSEVGMFYTRIAILAATLFLAGLVVLMSDYARIETVQSDSRSMLRTSWSSVKFVFRRFISTFGLQLAMVLATVCLVAAYLLVENPMSGSTAFGVLTLFVVQQLTVLARTWVRVATFAGERQLYLSFVPIQSFPVPVTGTPLLPAAVPEPVPVPTVPSRRIPARRRRTAGRAGVGVKISRRTRTRRPGSKR